MKVEICACILAGLAMQAYYVTGYLSQVFLATHGS